MGALFNGDEETSGLLTTVTHEQSQSKEARYARAYRRDPENNRRINLQKKRRRALKREKEMGSVSSMFEAEAAPTTVKPQPVENLRRPSDNASLSNPDGEASYGLSDSSQSYCQKDQKSIVTGSTKPLERKSSNLNTQNQAELLLEIRDCLVDLRESVKPATQMPPNYKQQACVSGIAITNGGNVAKKKTVAKMIAEKVPTFGLSLLLIVFLACNTFFLVSEQQSLYESMSYSAGMALMIAVLSEASLILLSAIASWTSNLEWKIGLTAGMLAMLAVMVGILDSSAKSRVNTTVRQSQEAKNIEKQLTTLRALEAPILARIKNLDPNVYPTKINELSLELTTPPNGHSYKIEQLTSRLGLINTADADTSKLIWQRRVSLFLNLLFSAFLGSLWAKKDKESFIQRMSKHVNGYLQKACEV